MFRGTGKYTYDLVVIGGGSGGVRASRIAAAHGAKVALIDVSQNHGPPHYSAIGGTCVNVGCVPKKLMVIGSGYRGEFADAKAFGWQPTSGGDLEEVKDNWSAFMAKKDAEISRLNGIYGNMLKNAGVEVLTGFGSLKSDHEVSIRSDSGDESCITADKILVATGGWPFKPDIPGIEHTITSNEIFYQEERPKRVVVVGGGYIAVEFASILNGFGSEVTLMYRGPLFLRGFDNGVREHLAECYKASSMNICFNTNPAKIEKESDGSLKVTTEAGDVFSCDQVLYATGRKPKTAGLGLETVGVALNDNGTVKVDTYSKTTVDNIYCVGDLTGRMDLTPVALYEGQCFADSVFGGVSTPPEYDSIASAVFSRPEIGTCGLTEEQAVAKLKDVSVFESKFRPMANTITGNPEKTLMKLIVDDKTQKVVGAHMVGPHAGEIIQGLSIAMRMGATKKDFDRTRGVHPTSAEEFVTMKTAARGYQERL